MVASADDKCCEKPQMFGRTKGYYIMIMPPIKLKTTLEPKIVFIFNFINNHWCVGPNVFSNSLFLHILWPVTPLYINA